MRRQRVQVGFMTAAVTQMSRHDHKHSVQGSCTDTVLSYADRHNRRRTEKMHANKHE